jgi:hypothetical protein
MFSIQEENQEEEKVVDDVREQLKIANTYVQNVKTKNDKKEVKLDEESNLNDSVFSDGIDHESESQIKINDANS